MDISIDNSLIIFIVSGMLLNAVWKQCCSLRHQLVRLTVTVSLLL